MIWQIDNLYRIIQNDLMTKYSSLDNYELSQTYGEKNQVNYIPKSL